MFENPLNFPFVCAFWSLALYIPTIAVYRLYFSPLSKFPGPTLAALTLWYEFYYDVVLEGQYTFKIKKLHEQYGPIIRINPYELHIADPSYYATLYTSSGSGEKRDKWGWYTKQFGTPEAMFSTASHDQHKVRRAALNRFFSMASVRRLQPMLEERMQRLLDRMREAKVSGKVIPLEYAFAAFTNGPSHMGCIACSRRSRELYVVTKYAYGHSENRLDREDWGPEYHDVVVEAGKAGSLMKQMIWIFHSMNALPAWVQKKLSPSLELVIRNQRHIENIIARIKKAPRSSSSYQDHPTLFHEILQSDLAESDKSTSRLKDEAVVVVGAGTLTTSWALAVAAYHLLSSPSILSKLKHELEVSLPDAQTPVPLPQLERLPYLTAIIQESLRLSYGVSSRLQRISPEKPLVFTESSGKSWVIPKGVPVGMTSVLVHHGESIFPDSHTFKPERWLETPRLERYLVAFSKGSRQCLGINLAYGEMYLCLSTVFRRFGSVGSDSAGEQGVRGKWDEGALELLSKDDCEVRIAADGFMPLRTADSKGISVRVRE